MTDSSMTTNSPPASEPSPQEKFMRGVSAMVAPERKEEAFESLMEMAKLLKAIPARAWLSRSCMEAVATARDRGVPTFAQVQKAMLGWLKQHPEQPTETPATKAGLPGEDGFWLNFWHKRKAEIEAGGMEAWAGRPTAADALANLASLVQQQAPAAWRVISGSRLAA